MKKIVLFVLAMCGSMFAYEPIYNGFLNVYWGLNPDEVNDRLMATNFVTAKAVAENVEIYENAYPDPTLTWNNHIIHRWTQFSFSTQLEKLIKVDPTIRYLTLPGSKEFKCLTFKGTALSSSNSWVYRFYFHQDKLFAVSLRYESEQQIARYLNRNTEKKDIHPGYLVPRFIFEETRTRMQQKYGGFLDGLFRSFDQYAAKYYKEYYRESNNSMITSFHQEYYGNIINYTISYIDNYEMYTIYKKLQSRYYDGTDDRRDLIGF
ncbi:MAG: hypothetical protein HZC28_10425 [Spirochaetes bacterium]|nr:hypothetical protein [Spirochaetota bacterium]